MRSRLLFSLPLLALAAAVHANDLIQNGSFEEGPYVQNVPSGSGALAHWTVTTGTIECLWNGGAYGFASDGDRYVDLTGSTDNSLNRMEQSIATTPGDTYRLTFDVQWISSLAGPKIRAAAGDLSVELSPSHFDTWQTESYVFTALSGSTVVSFENTEISHYGAIDNVHVSPVPEPASLAALGLGALALLRRRR